VGGWPGGTEAAAAACRVNGDGTVTVTVGAVDLTGSHSAMAAIAAEVLGLPPERVRVVTADTEQAPLAGMSAGSKTVYTVGAAVQAAAEDVRAQILAMAADVLEAAVHDLELRDGRVQIRGVPSRAVEIAELARMTARFGSRYAPLHGFGRSAVHVQAPGFAVHLARVRVDRETGRIQVLQYLAVQDVGRAINPAEVLGQIHGGIAQGIGRALRERLGHDPAGRLATATLSDYVMPTAGEMPPIEGERGGGARRRGAWPPAGCWRRRGPRAAAGNDGPAAAARAAQRPGPRRGRGRDVGPVLQRRGALRGGRAPDGRRCAGGAGPALPGGCGLRGGGAAAGGPTA